MENVVVDAQPPSNSAPVKTVPPEILCQIFQALALGNYILIQFSAFGRLKFHSALFALPRVCSLWRNISISQPSLWSTLLFKAEALNFSTPATIAKNEASLREFLQRSSDAMLHLSVVKCFGYVSSMTPAVASALEVFAEYAHRYRDLTFTFVDYAGLDDTWEKFRSTGSPDSRGILGIDVNERRLPHLESLTLDHYDSKSPHLLRAKPFSHRQSPRLHTLHISSLHSDTVIPGLNNLITLRVNLYIGSLAILLTNHPLLKKLTIHNITMPRPSIPSNFHLVSHTKLTTLIWGGISIDLDYGPRAWDSVYLPNLTGLGVNIHTPPKSGQSYSYNSEVKAFFGAGGSFQAMKAMLIRSNCTLENVSLYDIPEDVMKNFFRDVPMREGCRNGRVVYDIHNKVLAVFPSPTDLPESGIIAVAED